VVGLDSDDESRRAMGDGRVSPDPYSGAADADADADARLVRGGSRRIPKSLLLLLLLRPRLRLLLIRLLLHLPLLCDSLRATSWCCAAGAAGQAAAAALLLSCCCQLRLLLMRLLLVRAVRPLPGLCVGALECEHEHEQEPQTTPRCGHSIP